MFKMCVRSNALFSVILCLTIIYEAYDNTVRALNAHPESAVLLPVDPVKRKDDVLNLTCRAPANFSKLYVDINFKIFHNGIFINEDYSPQSGELGRRSVLLKKVLDENGNGNYSCTIQAQEGPKPRPNYTASTYVKILTDTETMAHQKPPLVQVGTGVSIQCLDKPHEGLVVNWEGGSSQSNTWDFTLDSLADVSSKRCRIATKTALEANDNDMDKAVASGSALVISRDFIGAKNSTEELDGIFNVSLTLKPSDVNLFHNLSVEWTSKGNPLQDVMKNFKESMLINNVVVNKTMGPISIDIIYKGIVIGQFRIPLVVNGQKTPSSSHIVIVLCTVIPGILVIIILIIIFVVCCLKRQKKCYWKESGQEKRTTEIFMPLDPQKVDQKVDNAEETLVMQP